MVVVVTAMMMVLGRHGIGARFGIEWGLDLHAGRAELSGELGKNVIAPNSQRIGQHLRRYMTVAEVPGDPGEMLTIGAADLQQQFRRGDDLDEPAILQQ